MINSRSGETICAFLFLKALQEGLGGGRRLAVSDGDKKRDERKERVKKVEREKKNCSLYSSSFRMIPLSGHG